MTRQIKRRRWTAKIGCGTIIVALVLVVGALALLNARRATDGHAPMPRPAGAPEPVATKRFLGVGEVGRLTLPGATGVWIALDESAWTPMIDAENEGARGGPGSGAAMYELAHAGRIKFYAVGTRVKVVGTNTFSRQVEVLDGEDQGDRGWVQMEFVGPE